MKKLLITLCILVTASFSINAEIQEVIENFSKENYEAGAQNWQAKKQKNGIMYFANMNALISFDGLKWTKRNVPGCGNNLRALHISNTGDVYVGGYNLFGVFKATSDGLSEYQSLSDLLDEKDKNFNEIWFINSIGNKIIFQSYCKLFIYENGKISIIDSGEKQMMYSTVVDNTLQVATRYDGILALSENHLVPLTYGAELENKIVCSIVNWNNKVLYITQNDGIFIYEPWSGINPFNCSANEELIKNQAFCAEISENKLAVGTVQNGVYIIDLLNDSYKNINTKNGLQNNTVLSLSFDANQDLWLGLDRGIDYINLNSPFKAIFNKEYNFGSGYTSLLANQTLYLGTNQGLFYTTYKDGNINDIKKIEGTQGQVYQIVQIDNKIYCCHHNGLFEVNGGSARKIVNVEGIWTIQRLQKNPGYLIAGCYNGLILLKNQNNIWSFYGKIDGYKESSRLFEQDENGDIWVSHGLLGVYRIELSEDLKTAQNVTYYGDQKGFAYKEHISVFKIDDKIIFAAEDNIYTYNSEKDIMEVNNTLLNNDNNARFLYFKKNNGKLWFLKNELIGYAEKQNDGKYSFNNNSCFSIPEPLLFEYFSLTTIDKNNILVSNEDGFTLIDLNLLNRIKLQDVYIRDIISTKNKEVLGHQYLKSDDNAKKIEIPYSENSVEFQFSSVSFSDSKNKQIKYSTRLSDYETEWSEPNYETTAVYTDLPRGTYTFQVKTINRNSESSISSYKITILPPWYNTVWAYIGYALLIMLIVILINRYVKHKERKLELKNQKQLEKQRETYEKEKAEKEKQLVELKNQYLEEELKHKGNELASSTMNLIRKNEIMIDIKDDIQKIIVTNPTSEDNKQTNKKLEKIINKINENIEHDDDWMKFEKEFDSIHQNFIKRLSEQYKGLTINDKKLCAYLKMNLVSKDIAPLLNISVRGVEIGRYRLRKKLNLDRETNLTEFLQNF